MPFFRFWDMLTMLLLCYTALVTPFEVAFLELDLQENSELALFIVNRCVDFGFVLDMIFNFMLEYYDDKGRKIQVLLL